MTDKPCSNSSAVVREMRTKWAAHIERPEKLQAQPLLLKDFAELLGIAEEALASLDKED